MKEPSSEQLKAITHIRGPAELIAGPGSGKTFTIVSRIQNLIRSHHVSSDHILVVTFSKAAANEMVQRFYKECGDYGVHFGTFHSLAWHILKEYFGFRDEALISDGEKRRMLSQILSDHGYGKLCTGEFLRSVLDEISRRKNLSDDKTVPFIPALDITEETLGRMIEEYHAFLRDEKKIDFDDMILEALRLLKEYPKVLDQCRERFRYILADEFQDINPPQYELIKLLSHPLNNLFVVGDDDQSIYGFRGSSPGIMQKFFLDYPDAQKLMLTDNYRSGDQIVSFATAIISQNRNRFEKTFHPMMKGGTVSYYHTDTHLEEERVLLGLLSKLPAPEYERSAIILRTNRDVKVFLRLLSRHGFSVRNANVPKTSVFDSPIADDFAAYLRFLYEGERREDLIRFMNRPNLYLRRDALIRERVSFTDLYRYYEKNPSMVKTLKDYENKLMLARRMSPRYAISLYRKQIGYDRYLKETASSDDQYRENLFIADTIEKALDSYESGQKMDDFFTTCASNDVSERKEDPKNDGGSGISVITMHQSKGLEFDHVFLPDVNEGVIPSKKSAETSPEEECRLLYVAATRARLALTLMATEERNREVSRFIKKTDLVKNS